MGTHQVNRQCTVVSCKSKVIVPPLNFINTIVSVRTNGYISLAAGRAAAFGDNISTLREAVASLPHKGKTVSQGSDATTLPHDGEVR
jgi:hypothetical protein